MPFHRVFWVAVVGALLSVTTLNAEVLEGWTVDFKAAKATAAKDGKDLFMEFTGSDWCPSCKMLKSKILKDDAFKTGAPEHFVLVELDYPQDKSHQSDATIEQNNQLQEAYGIQGFPTIILADAQGRPYFQAVGFPGIDAAAYVKMIAKKKTVRVQRDENLRAAALTEGVEKAQLLDKALRRMDPEIIVSAYADEAGQIIDLDPNNTAGLKAKYQAIQKLPKIKAKLEELGMMARRGEGHQAIAKIDAMIKDEALVGPPLQEALWTKAALSFQAGKQSIVPALLKQAIEASPDSNRAEMIRQILAQMFPGSK